MINKNCTFMLGKVFALLMVCWSSMLAANPIDSAAQLEEFIQAELKRWKVPGAAVVLVKDGEIIFEKYSGYRDMEQKLPVNRDTLFPIGSITKGFTAAGTGVLVDEGLLSWTTPIHDVIPEFELKDEFASNRCNAIDLLSHRTGLPGHDLMWYFADLDRNELVKRVAYLEPSADLRERLQYSNLMFTVAGWVIEQRSGDSWEDFTKEKLLEPLAMTRSNFTIEALSSDANHALPYTDKDGEITKMDYHDLSSVGPSGSINSTALEMSNWLMMNVNHGEFDGRQVVSKESMQMIQTPHMPWPNQPQESGPNSEAYTYTMYGLGWIIGTYHGSPLLEHRGSIDGYNALATLLPRQNAAFIILTNSFVGGDIFASTVGEQLISRIVGVEAFDWGGFIQAEMDESAKAEQSDQAKAEKPEAAEKGGASHPHQELVGTYRDKGYGDVVIEQGTDTLMIRYYRFNHPLQQVEYDIFKSVGGIINRKVNFISDSKGVVSKLEIQFDRSTPAIVFERVADDTK